MNSLFFELQFGNFDCFSIDNIKVPALGFADDFSVMSMSLEGLIRALIVFIDHLNNFDMIFNHEKSKIIVFGAGADSVESQVEIAGQKIDVTAFFKYLEFFFPNMESAVLQLKTANYVLQNVLIAMVLKYVTCPLILKRLSDFLIL